MFKNRKLEIKLVKDAEQTLAFEPVPMDLEPYAEIFRETVKFLVIGSIVTIAFGFTARTVSEIIIANYTP